MTKDEKIKNYQTALNCLRHVENIFDNINNTFPSKGGASYKQFLIARNNASVARDMILEDFINDTFTDCDSDCATVQNVKKPIYNVKPISLVKGSEVHNFDSLTDAARFVSDNYGGNVRSIITAISKIILGHYHQSTNLLHGYSIVSDGKTIIPPNGEIDRRRRGVVLTKGAEVREFESYYAAAKFIAEKCGGDPKPIATAISSYFIRNPHFLSPSFGGYIPSLPADDTKLFYN